MGSEEKAGGEGGPPAPFPEVKYIVGAYVGVAIAALIAIWIASKNDLTIGVTEGFAPFAVIYIVAQAVERLVQPFTYLLGKAEQKADAKKALIEAKTHRALGFAAREADKVTAAASNAIHQQKRLDVIQADRAILFWAIATCAALLVCGLLDLGLIQSIADVTDSSGQVPSWFDRADVVLTGIAIGSGTKPLHDVIAFVQNAKQKSEPTGGGAAV